VNAPAAVPIPEQAMAIKRQQFRAARLKTVAMIRLESKLQIFNSKNLTRRGNKCFAAELISFG
jgi:hypothetical protein